jgi:hypothetical protein
MEVVVLSVAVVEKASEGETWREEGPAKRKEGRDGRTGEKVAIG